MVALSPRSSSGQGGSSAAAAPPPPPPPPALGDSPYLGREERQLLEQGKAEHRETTKSARRALKLAEQTVDVAQGTLVEVHRQGQQLERAELGMHRVGEEIREASALLRFMRRWCCLQCCDCCDPTVDKDRTRKQRVAAAKKAAALEEENVARRYGAKQQSVTRVARQHDPAYGGGSGSEGAAYAELMARAGEVRQEWRGPRAADIGHGLPAEDKRELAHESRQQDQLLDRIGGAVESLKAMGQEMHGELAGQAPRLDRLHDRTAATHDQLGALSRQAHRI